MPSSRLKLSKFNYDYPRELIALHPTENRDESRLMVLHRKEKRIEHRQFCDIVEYFKKGDVLIYNDTKVFPARLQGIKEKTGAKIEVFLLRELNSESRLWDVIVDPARKIRIGNKLFFDDALVAEVIDNTTSRGRTIRFVFNGTNEELHEAINRVGQTPLPPYIKRKIEQEDRARYQTIFAEHRGAVAAPTAGLHFTPELCEALRNNGVDMVPITLHVGLGTFRRVEVEDLTKHRMHSENYTIPAETATTVNRALVSENSKVTAIGTTVVRAVETSLMVSGLLKGEKPGQVARQKWTDKFIYPPYKFMITQQLITNFHMPKTTLLMLVAAFAGFDFVMEAYREAIEHEYRLFSYGDAMLIL